MLPRHKTFKPRTAPLSRGKQTAIERCRQRIRKVGRQGRENARALRIFKRECARLGLGERCECGYEGCTGQPDTWAHGRKRRLLRPGELERFAVVACVNCHRKLDEQMSHEEMAAEVDRIIQLRPERYWEAA